MDGTTGCLLLALCLVLLQKGAGQNYKVVCDLSDWSAYRDGDGSFQPEDIDAALCTHVHYTFANLDNETLLLKPSNPHLSIKNKLYKRVTGLKCKEPELKVLLTMGGWIDSEGSKYSAMVASPGNRQEFVQQAIAFLKRHEFDGLVLDWEYPTCWRADCNAGPAADRENFATLLRELREAFNKLSPRLLLSVSVPTYREFIVKGFDASVLEHTADYITVLTYDMRGYWDKRTGHHAALYYRKGDTSVSNVEDVMQFWVRQGVSPGKLLIGIPAYGRSFTLADPNDPSLGAPTVGKGTPEEFSKEAGFMAYYEICRLEKNKDWIKVRDPDVGPYIYKGDQWISYDDPQSVWKKTQFVKERGYGGVKLRDISTDDFLGKCDCGKYPLLGVISNGLLGYADIPISIFARTGQGPCQ